LRFIRCIFFAIVGSVKHSMNLCDDVLPVRAIRCHPVMQTIPIPARMLKLGGLMERVRLVGGLTLVAVLAFAGWRWSVNGRGAANPAPAAAATLHTERETSDVRGDAGRRISKPPDTSARPITQPVAASGTLNSGDRSQANGVDLRWQVAAGLPRQVREQLARSTDPGVQDILQRNDRLLSPATSDDAWGTEMQNRLNEFFESKPEAESLQIAIACREAQCQIQATSLDRSSAGSTLAAQALFDTLSQHWWFRDRLTLAQSHVTTVNGRLYQLQYFDRKQ
jgi:hypothetical protein